MSNYESILSLHSCSFTHTMTLSLLAILRCLCLPVEHYIKVHYLSAAHFSQNITLVLFQLCIYFNVFQGGCESYRLGSPANLKGIIQSSVVHMSNPQWAIQTQISPYCTHASGVEQVAACDVESPATCKSVNMWMQIGQRCWEIEFINTLYITDIMLLSTDECKWTAVEDCWSFFSLWC